MLPALVRDGFRGNIWSTPVTGELCAINLLDSAHLQEEDARFANKMSFSKHKPALPLFTTADAERAIKRLKAVEYETPAAISSDVSVRFIDAGHILGSAIVEVTCRGQAPLRIVFSGDLGRYDALILRDPAPVEEADYLLVESTYGNRLHPPDTTVDDLATVINETARRGGMTIIPAFAVGRAQTLLYLLREMKERRSIPDLPIFVDSPMARRVTNVFCRHVGDFDEEARAVYRRTGECPILSSKMEFVHTKDESQKINNIRYPAIIVSASGMATGGRVLHHLKYRLPDPRSTVVFVGYQGVGTRGQLLRDGAKYIKSHGEEVPVRARICNIGAFSGHADCAEILRWLEKFRKPPKTTFVVHGEEEASKALAAEIERKLGWKTRIPKYLESFDLFSGQ
jgi:metallo-beta-lactamase family protein